MSIFKTSEYIGETKTAQKMVILKYVFFPFSFSIAILLLYKKEIKRFITQTEQKIVHHETDKEIVIKLIYYFHMLHHRGAEQIHPKFPAVHEKLKHDKASFELLKTLVFLYGLENERMIEKGNARTFYNRHYNFLHPLPRFFEWELLDELFKNIATSELVVNEKEYKSIEKRFYHFIYIQKINKALESEKLRPYYLKLISDYSNYHFYDAQQEEEHFNDYLTQYYIKSVLAENYDEDLD